MNADHNLSLTLKSLVYIGNQIDIANLKDIYRPGQETISGTARERKNEIFKLAEKLWGISPDEWLKMEKDWLQSGRASSGSELVDGKDNLDDVVSAELLIRILAASIAISNKETPLVVKEEVLYATNLVLSEAVAKGRTRLTKVEGKSVYSVLKQAGVMIGVGGGKYLPNPEESLPELFKFLNRNKINPEAYR